MFRRVFLITIDSLRYDALSCCPDRGKLRVMGLDKVPHTSNLDYFARNGVFFTNYFVTAPYTTSSYASMLSGLFPPKHGVRSFYANKLSDDVCILPELFNANGFRTFYLVDSNEIFARLNMARGVDYYNVSSDDSLLEQLSNHINDKVFVFLHLFDAHIPYGKTQSRGLSHLYNHDKFDYAALDVCEGVSIRIGNDGNWGLVIEAPLDALSQRLPHKDVLVQRLIMHYLEGVNKFDVARFAYLVSGFRDLGLFDESLIIVTADHGESLTPDRKAFTHGRDLSDASLRVPLIMFAPGHLPEGKRVDRLVSAVDLMPTLAELCDLDRVPTQGQSFAHLLCGDGESRDFIYAEFWRYKWSEVAGQFERCGENGAFVPPDYDTFISQRCVRTERYKYVLKGMPLAEGFGSILDLEEKQQAAAFIRRLYGEFETEEEVTELLRSVPKGNGNIASWMQDIERRALGREALYDIMSDPDERFNLLLRRESCYEDIARDMARKLASISLDVRQTGDADYPYSEDEAEHVLERLRSLGYV